MLVKMIVMTLRSPCEKPQLGYCMWLGSKSGAKPRPIKVCFSSANAAIIRLWKSGQRFREKSGTKKIYIAPDRTREERLERKKLVDLMKPTKKCDPWKQFYISDSTVMIHRRLIITMDSWKETEEVVRIMLLVQYSRQQRLYKTNNHWVMVGKVYFLPPSYTVIP